MKLLKHFNIQNTEQFISYLKKQCIICSVKSSDFSLNSLLEHQMVRIDTIYKLLIDILNIIKEYSYLNIIHGGINKSNILYNKNTHKFYLKCCSEYLLTSLDKKKREEIKQSYDIKCLGKLCMEIYKETIIKINKEKDGKLYSIINKMINNEITSNELLLELQEYNDEEIGRSIVKDIHLFLRNNTLIVKPEFLDEIVNYYKNEMLDFNDSANGNYQITIIGIDYPDIYFKYCFKIIERRSIRCSITNILLLLLL